MFFVHGGSFVMGAGSAFNGTALAAEQHAVVVTINYRLGSFGFFSSSQQSSQSLTTGNFGLQDQREALRWVRDQIGAFGGDKNRVLLFGESAGAISVQLHVLLPESHGLFQSVLTESGFPVSRGLAYSHNVSDIFAAKAGCKDGPARLGGASRGAQRDEEEEAEEEEGFDVLGCLRGMNGTGVARRLLHTISLSHTPHTPHTHHAGTSRTSYRGVRDHPPPTTRRPLLPTVENLPRHAVHSIHTIFIQHCHCGP